MIVVLLFVLIGFGIVALAHTAPAPFVLDAVVGHDAVWHMSRDEPHTVYLTYDDGPNPSTTPDLLDVLAREHVRTTFFLIDDHVTVETAPIVQRMFADGHSVALHSGTRALLLQSPDEFARTLTEAADRIEALTGQRPCRAFRPHAGWRSGMMFEGLRQIDYRLVGWGWMLWDFNWFRERNSDATVGRLSTRIRGGDIVVMHDGDESAPTRDQRHTVAATASLIPSLRDRGFRFGAICDNDR